MNNAYSKCSLFFCPNEHNYKHHDKASLISLLRDIDLISGSPPLSEQTLQYSVGEKFLDYIAYMGCSPAIQFDATKDRDNFCHIKVHRHESPQLIYSKKQFFAPLCPVCKKPAKNWQQNRSEAAIRCEHCQTVSGIETFNWRRMAGYAQLFIEITDIFPKEAVPQQILMDKLAAISGTDWLYFYSCH